MKFLKYLSLIIPLLLQACAQDFPGNGNPADADGMVALSYAVDGQLQETRSVPANDWECRLNSAYMLFFEADGDRRFVDCVRLLLDQEGKAKFAMPSSLGEKTDYKTLIVGNPDAYFPDKDVYSSFEDYVDGIKSSSNSSGGRSFEWFRNNLAARFESPITSSLTDMTLPMWGELVNSEGEEIPFSYVKNDTNYIVEGRFLFRRALSRIDMLNLVPGQLKIAYVKLCNYQPQGLYFEDWLKNGQQPVTLEEASPAPKGDGSDGYMKVDYSEEYSTQELKEALYCFHNTTVQGVVNDRKTTCLIIAGYYYDKQTQSYDEDLTYYRVNINNMDDSQFFKRNFMYRIVVKSVLMRGEKTDKEAYDRDRPVLDINIEDDWDTSGDNIVTDDDGNILIISKTQITFPGAPLTASLLNVYTSPGMEWTFAAASSDSQAFNNYGRFDVEKIPDQNGRVETSTTLKVATNEINESDGAIYGYYDIIATNTLTKKQIKKRVSLQQLSSKMEAIVISVDDCVGTIEKDWSGNGGSMTFKVRTGTKTANWVCKEKYYELTSDPNPTTSVWHDKLEQPCTPMGADGATLRITLPPYIAPQSAEPRVMTFTVQYAGNDDLDENKKIPTVLIRVTQKPATKLIFINNPLSDDGYLELDAFSTSTANPHGIGLITELRVSLLDPANYNYKVIATDFNPNTDLYVSQTNEGYATKYNYNATGAEVRSDVIAGFSQSDGGARVNNPFIHVYRTGPGDPAIEGSISVVAYPKTENADDVSINQYNSESVPVRIVTPRNVLIDDVAWYIDFGSGKSAYMIVADRYVGHPAKKTYSEAPFCTEDPNLVCGKIHFDGTDSKDTLMDIRNRFIYNVAKTQAVSDVLQFKNKWTTDNSGSPAELYFYTQDKLDGWVTDMEYLYDNDLSQWPPKVTARFWDDNLFRQKMIFSKGRAFIVSDLKKYVDGVQYTVCNWYHQPVSYCGSPWFILTQYNQTAIHFTCYPNSDYKIYGAYPNSIFSEPIVSKPYRFCTYDEMKEYAVKYLKHHDISAIKQYDSNW